MASTGVRQRKRADDEFDDEPQRMTLGAALKTLDVYPKVDADFAVQTEFGGITSIVTMVIVVILFFSELNTYMTGNSTYRVGVDTMSQEKLPIHFNITFPRLRCSQLHIDMVDKLGEMHLNVHENIFKQRLTKESGWIGQPFSDQEPEDSEEEGCLIWGEVIVAKVAGNIHWAIGASSQRNIKQHTHTFVMEDVYKFNASHTINEFRFGEAYPGMPSPLDGSVEYSPGIGHWAYKMQVVPTIYTDLANNSLITNQFTYTYHLHTMHLGEPMNEHSIPGVFFHYDMSPFLVKVGEEPRPFSRFLISCCAILGGVFTISGIIDSLFFHGSKFIK